MHKKLEGDLVSLAHSILQMKNRDDVFALEEKAKVISSKLSMLAFVETYVNTTPNPEETKEELISKVEKAFDAKDFHAVIEDEIAVVQDLEITKEAIITDTIEEEILVNEASEEKEETITEAIEEQIEEVLVNETSTPNEETEEGSSLEVSEELLLEQSFDELEETLFSSEEPQETINEHEKDEIEIKTSTLEEELKDTIPVDVMANLFEMAQPKSLNDALTKNIQIGLNDRIAFVKNLFDGSQEDFNRVVSQLNSFKTEKDAIKFINKMVKPDYNWMEQEEFEVRFMEIIQRKFV
jgi:hypothetical protein